MKYLDRDPIPGELRTVRTNSPQWVHLFDNDDEGDDKACEMGTLVQGDVVIYLGTEWKSYINVLSRLGVGTIHASGLVSGEND